MDPYKHQFFLEKTEELKSLSHDLNFVTKCKSQLKLSSLLTYNKLVH